MVSRLREFLMDHGHEDLIGRLQRGKINSFHGVTEKKVELDLNLNLMTENSLCHLQVK